MRFSVKEKDHVVILEFEGEIRLMGGAPISLQTLIKEQLAAGKVNILLNFAKVDFIDSYGIGDLVAGYVSIQNKGGKLKIAGLSQKIRLIFNYASIPRIIEIFDDVDSALKSFNK